jgi:hypothetical protein
MTARAASNWLGVRLVPAYGGPYSIALHPLYCHL